MALTTMLANAKRKGGMRIFLCATDQQQAALAFDSLRGFVRRNQGLAAHLRVLQYALVYPRADSRIDVLPADAAGSWGLWPDLIIVDELSQWRTERHAEFLWSLYSSLGKVPDARMLVATTAHWDKGGLCWKTRELVKADPAWRFSVRGQCASWVSAEFLEVQKRLLPAHLYQMLHENVWTQAGAEFLTWQEIDGCFDAGHVAQREPVTGAWYRFGLDIGTARDRTALAIVRADGDTIVVDGLALWQGTPQSRVSLDDVEATVAELAARFRPVEILMDPTEGLLLAERLRAKHLRVTEHKYTSTSRAALFDTLLQVIRQQRLRAFPHPVFRDELAGLRWTEKAGVLRPDHPAGGHDDAVSAVSLAVLGAVRAAARPAVTAGGIGGPSSVSRWVAGAGGMTWSDRFSNR